MSTPNRQIQSDAEHRCACWCQCFVAISSLVLLLIGINVAAADSFKVMSFNILADTLEGPSDAWLDPDHPRRDRVGAVLIQEDADILGLQEVTENQLADLISFLPGYDYLSRTGRVGGNVIFYRRDRFQLQGSGSVHLTGARTGAWTHLLDTATNQPMVVFDAHFFGDSSQKTAQAAELQAAIPNIAADLPVILTGDFNFVFSDSPRSSISDEFLEVTGRAGTQNRLLVDAGNPLYGATTTDSDGSSRIDFVTNSDEFQVIDGHVVTTLIDGLRPSDHRPVTTELLFTPVGSERTRWPVQSNVLLDRFLSGTGAISVHSQLAPQTPVGVFTVSRILGSGSGELEGKFDVRFTVPEATDSSPAIASAVLRLYVSDVIGDLQGGLSLTHRVDKNDLGVAISDFQLPYMDTGLDLIVPSDGTDMYYELDVTEFILADMLADGSNPLAAFRLEITDGPPLAGGEEAAYVIDSTQFAPQLVISFIPEPSTLALAAGGLLCLAYGRRKRA